MASAGKAGTKVYKTRGVVMKSATKQITKVGKIPLCCNRERFTVFLDGREGGVKRVKAFGWVLDVEAARRAKAWREMNEKKWKETEGQVLSDAELFGRKLASLSF